MLKMTNYKDFYHHAIDVDIKRTFSKDHFTIEKI